MCALACGGGEQPPPSAEALADARHLQQPTEQGRATWPADACGWIPVADVEAILGPLVEPPAGSVVECRYALPVDAATATRRAKLRETARSQAGPELGGAILNPEMDSVAVVVTVDLAGDVSLERLSRISGDTSIPAFVQQALDGTTPPVDSGKPVDRPKPPPGWDVADAPSGNGDFTGRVGHLKVMIQENSADQVIPSGRKAALAARIRDRIADLPFAYPYPVPDPTRLPPGADPCSLLRPDEAEAVLGRLVVPPYRSHHGSPYADANGSSCAYYTAGHHVLILEPEWADGKQRVAELRAADDLLFSLAQDPDAAIADTLDGPWEDVTIGLAGKIGFLSGDRLLQVAYLTSSTDAAGAVTLARIAIRRLAGSSPTR